MKLSEGLSDGDTKIQLKGRGDQIAIPNPLSINATLDVQLQQESGLVCRARRSRCRSSSRTSYS
jgi:hypothetical protein